MKKTYITGQIEPFSEAVKDKFDKAENYLKEMNHVPINPLKINAYQLAPWSQRLELLSGCTGIFLLNDSIQSTESIIEKHLCELSGKEIIFQAHIDEQVRMESFERPIIDRVTFAIEIATGKKFDEYKEENRKPEVFYPRVIFSYQCFKNGLSEERIAYYLGRDVSTIKYHQLRKYDDLFKWVKDFKSLAERVDCILHPEKCLNQTIKV